MIFIYNNDGKIKISSVPIAELESKRVQMSQEQVRHCNGFDSNGNPTYDQFALDNEAKQVKEKTKSQINSTFDKECKEIGVMFEGEFFDLNSQPINDPCFQYDDISRSRLLEVKDDSRVSHWRSVSQDTTRNNRNVILTNEEKNRLYELLKFTYYTKFSQKSTLIDNLGD